MNDTPNRNLPDGRDPSRRRFLCAGIAGLGTGLAVPVAGAEEKSEKRFKPYDRKTRFQVGKRGREMLEKAYELGHHYEGKHGGCCRCTVAALQGALDFIPEDAGLFRSATCLDGGASPTAKQNCGGFTGSGIVIGYVCGGENFKGTGLAHGLLHKVARKFIDEYGSVLCQDVRKGVSGDCPEAVGRAARWAAEALLEQFTDYPPK